MKITTFAPNQLLVEDGTKKTFQSYNSIIAVIEDGKTTLDQKFWNFSNTTGKYRNQFLNETKKETEQKIKAGIYTLSNLN